MVAMGRSLIADPMFPKKARQGKEKEIVHCIACAQGCFDNLFKLKHVECLCNPMAGHEMAGYEKDEDDAPTSAPKKVMIVGGGPAGMSAALTAHRRGHLVTLYESSDRLGGQLHLAAAPPGRDEFLQFAKDLTNQMEVNKIPVLLNQTVNEDLIKEQNPDFVMLATGAKPLVPQIPGLDLPHVVDAWDVLESTVETGNKVVIVGGGAVGVEAALFLAEKGTISPEALKFLLVNKAETPEILFELATKGSKKVCLIEMMEKIGADIGKSTKWGMMQDLGRLGVETITLGAVTKITETGLEYETDGMVNQVAADSVVVAAGSRSYNPLESLMEKLNMPCMVIGDAKKVATAFDAVHDGYKVAIEI